MFGINILRRSIFVTIQRKLSSKTTISNKKLLTNIKTTNSTQQLPSDVYSGPSEKRRALTMSSEPVGQIVGGLGRTLEQNDQVKAVVEKIKPILEERAGVKYESLEVIHYRPQVVAGTNYFVKAKAKLVDGEEQIVHLRIYENLKRELDLTAYQLGKSLGDQLEYFQ